MTTPTFVAWWMLLSGGFALLLLALPFLFKANKGRADQQGRLYAIAIVFFAGGLTANAFVAPTNGVPPWTKLFFPAFLITMGANNVVRAQANDDLGYNTKWSGIMLIGLGIVIAVLNFILLART